LINIAHDWLLPVAAVSSLDDSAEASASDFFRIPRDLFEYQP
jgi:hypothetical protein